MIRIQIDLRNAAGVSIRRPNARFTLNASVGIDQRTVMNS
jgi:hypothetical protein